MSRVESLAPGRPQGEGLGTGLLRASDRWSVGEADECSEDHAAPPGPQALPRAACDVALRNAVWMSANEAQEGAKTTQRMRQKLSSFEGRALYRQRRDIVEPAAG